MALTMNIRASGPLDGQTDWQKYMLNQVMELRSDVMDHLVECHQNNLAGLTRELREVQQAEERLREQERLHTQQVAQLQQQLTSPDLDQDAKPQLETMLGQLSGSAAERLRSEHASLADRNAELTRLIAGETERSQKLQQRGKQLQAALNAQ
jgi:DNA gyrase/topoisomerase IV subunit A